MECRRLIVCFTSILILRCLSNRFIGLFGYRALHIFTLLDNLLPAMGKMRNCGMWNAEGKMRNENCGTIVPSELEDAAANSSCMLLWVILNATAKI